MDGGDSQGKGERGGSQTRPAERGPRVKTLMEERRKRSPRENKGAQKRERPAAQGR